MPQRRPSGTYRFADWLANDGIRLDEPIRIEAAVTLKDTDLIVDFTGTSPLVCGPFNAVPSSVLATVYYVIRAITDLSIPNNAGCFRPVRLHLPPGSLVNPDPPAPVNARALHQDPGADSDDRRHAERVHHRAIQTLERPALDRWLGPDAAGMAADLGLRGADAVYVATAHHLGLPLVTWDVEQRERGGRLITVRTPNVRA